LLGERYSGKRGRNRRRFKKLCLHMISNSGHCGLEQFLKCDDRRQAMEAESLSSE
jgi:hypothetical protein